MREILVVVIVVLVLMTCAWFMYPSLAEDTANESLSWATAEKDVLWYYDGKTTHRYSLDKSEPNEPRYYHPLDLNAYTCPKCYEGAKGDSCPGHYAPESNEPEAISSWINIADLNEPKKVSLDFIPTWSDYIELEKDLYIEIPIEGFGPIETRCYVYRKGTKIYFKGDE